MNTTIEVICFKYTPLKNNKLPLKLRITQNRFRYTYDDDGYPITVVWASSSDDYLDGAIVSFTYITK